jgi:ubiquinone/menaquinone biosynthesis C-methylase UbiE
MSDTKPYMKHMYEVFENTRRQGPGSDETTLRAYQALPQGFTPKRIIDMGCGKGQTSLFLAKESGAHVVAVDNHQPFLDWLEKAAKEQGLGDRVNAQCADMNELPYKDQSFDLLWSEGSAYIMGFTNALTTWRRLLTPGGCLVLSEAVWLVDDPAPELYEFWTTEYPDIKDLGTRLAQARERGYLVLDSFVMPMEDWDTFYDDVEKCLLRAIEEHGASPAFDDIAQEIDIYKSYRGHYGYVFLVLQSA